MYRMYRLTGLLLFALIGVGAAPPASLAQPNVEAAQSWGLIGTWRLDCKVPLSHSNPDLKYVVRDGKLFHDRNFGDTADSHPVIAATPRPGRRARADRQFQRIPRDAAVRLRARRPRPAARDLQP